jgi:dephospho-CoA kinase
LTGGIGSGKTVVRRLFSALGVPGIDVDEIARHIHQNPAHPAMAAVAASFPQSLAADGRLQRGSLRSRFAMDKTANRELKRILRPYVIAEIAHWAQDANAPYVVCESALAMEEDLPRDRVLVVDASDEARIARVLARNPDWSRSDVQNILSMQMSRADYLTDADDVVRNDGSLEELKQQVEALHRTYVQNRK